MSAITSQLTVRNGIMERGGRWILDIDVRKYFSSIPYAQLREALTRRVTDGVVRRLIDKWLKAGVLEEGQLFYPDMGTPEGGVISPVLSNIFLHYVLDDWFTHVVQPRLRGPSTLVRYADDFVMLFAYKDDAERIWRVLGKRLGKFGLQIHPNKSRMVDFRYQPRVPHDDGGSGLATIFNFLGFSHLWVLSRRGKPVVRQQMAKDRLARALRGISQQCRRMQHWLLGEQHQRLRLTLRGLYGYFGISGNYKRLSELVDQARACWRKWLSRRSNDSRLTWDQFREVLKRLPLPAPFILHRYAGA